jgi:hypothetical protein
MLSLVRKPSPRLNLAGQAEYPSFSGTARQT